MIKFNRSYLKLHKYIPLKAFNNIFKVSLISNHTQQIYNPQSA